MNYKKYQDLESTNAGESIPSMLGNSWTSQTSHSERKLSPSSLINVGFQKSVKASTEERSLQMKTVNCCVCGQVLRLLTEGYYSCSGGSSLSLNSSHGCEEQESSNLHTLDENLMSNTEGITLNSQSGHTMLLHERVSSVSIMILTR